MKMDPRVVLNVGCGPKGRGHGFTGLGDWHEVRMDIDPAVQPDVTARGTRMAAMTRRDASAMAVTRIFGWP